MIRREAVFTWRPLLESASDPAPWCISGPWDDRGYKYTSRIGAQRTLPLGSSNRMPRRMERMPHTSSPVKDNWKRITVLNRVAGKTEAQRTAQMLWDTLEVSRSTWGRGFSRWRAYIYIGLDFLPKHVTDYLGKQCHSHSFAYKCNHWMVRKKVALELQGLLCQHKKSSAIRMNITHQAYRGGGNTWESWL